MNLESLPIDILRVIVLFCDRTTCFNARRVCSTFKQAFTEGIISVRLSSYQSSHLHYLNCFPNIIKILIHHSFRVKSIPLLRFQQITHLNVSDWNKHLHNFTSLTFLRVNIQHLDDIRRVLETAKSISTLRQLYISMRHDTLFQDDDVLRDVSFNLLCAVNRLKCY